MTVASRLRLFVPLLLCASMTMAAQSPDLATRDDSAGAFAYPIAQYTPDPVYPAAARRAGVSGSVVLRIMIGRDGCAHNIRVVRRIGHGLDRAAIDAVRAWRFRRPNTSGVVAQIRLSFSPNMADRPLSDLTPCTLAQ